MHHQQSNMLYLDFIVVIHLYFVHLIINSTKTKILVCARDPKVKADV